MREKNGKLYIVFTLLLVIFSIGIVEKSMQNDTFFTIAIAEEMLAKGGLDGTDHLTQHENLNFTHSGWIFDLAVYGAYKLGDFFGIYFLTIIITGMISIVIFNILLKEENNIVLSFIISICAIFISKGVFAARGQLFSFLIFVIEMYAISGLSRTGKRRYIITLLILPIILANTHDTVWPFYFILFLPYIVESIISKIKILNTDEPYKVIVRDYKCCKTMIIIILISLLTGLITPVFATPYINLISVMKGASKSFIAELQKVSLLEMVPLLSIFALNIGIIGFTKTKIRLKDLLFVFGFLVMSLMAGRNCYFLYLIGIISVCNIITAFLKTYEKDGALQNIVEVITNNNTYLICLSIMIILISTLGVVSKLKVEYVNKDMYPVKAVEWMKKNLDIRNIKIYNGFNYGSYLELNGIKVFIDSRSGMYCDEFTKGSTIMTDYLNLENGNINYKDIFDKYNFSHILLYDFSIINQYIYEDPEYECVYQDELYVLYEKK